MNKLEQAARQALEALIKANHFHDYEDEITALREALAEQAEQEPVAWHHPQCEGKCIACLIEKAVQDAYGTQGRDYMLRHINAAPVRTKDLTDDEIMKINVDTASIVPTCDRQFHFARAVIAAFKEKNK